MLGKRSDQKGLWEADRLYLDYVGKVRWTREIGQVAKRESCS